MQTESFVPVSQGGSVEARDVSREGNTSGQGKNAVVPEEIKKWNWGAFLWTWIWGVVNKTYIAFAVGIPYIGWIVVPFLLGAKGSEWAWRNRRWQNIEHFRRVQHKWAVWGLVGIVATPALLWLIYVVFLTLLFGGFFQ